MYLTEVLTRFGNSSEFSIDFYSFTFSDNVKVLINQYTNCHIMGAIQYKDIPKLKGKYDVGLVMYKAESLNFKYNAPNKIFEYLALDMDVWCSDRLFTAKEYKRDHCYPKLLMVDYDNLETFNENKALDKTGLAYKQSNYICEEVYESFLEHL
jgi:hypothetical protein